jgi:hypothetical protein
MLIAASLRSAAAKHELLGASTDDKPHQLSARGEAGSGVKQEEARYSRHADRYPPPRARRVEQLDYVCRRAKEGITRLTLGATFYGCTTA